MCIFVFLCCYILVFETEDRETQIHLTNLSHVNNFLFHICPANIYLFKVNNRNNRKRWEIFSKLTMKTPKRRQRRRFGIFYC